MQERRPTLSRLEVPGLATPGRRQSIPTITPCARDKHRRSSTGSTHSCSSVQEEDENGKEASGGKDEEDAAELDSPKIRVPRQGHQRRPSAPALPVASLAQAADPPRRLSLSVPSVPILDKKKRRWSTQNAPVLTSVGEEVSEKEQDAGVSRKRVAKAATTTALGNSNLNPVDEVMDSLFSRMQEEVLRRRHVDSDSSGLSDSGLSDSDESDSESEDEDEAVAPDAGSRSRKTSVELARQAHDEAPDGMCVPMPFSMSKDNTPRGSANASPATSRAESSCGGATTRSGACTPRSGACTPRSGAATPRSGARTPRGGCTPLSPRSPRMSFCLPTQSPRSTLDSETQGSGLSMERDFHAGDTIGAGSFGRVFSARHRGSGMIIAVKEMLIDGQKDDEAGTDENGLSARERELRLCETLRHERVVRYFGHEYTTGILGGVTSGKLLLFLEYCSGGSVAQHLRTYGPLEEQLLAKYSQQLLGGLSYLHSLTPPVVHRDLKCANLLLTHDANVKIADFGCSKWLSSSQNFEEGKHSMVGSVFWTAPEVLKGDGALAISSDYWSFGSCVLEMATAKHPWSEHPFDNIFQACRLIVYSDKLPEVPNDLGACVQDVCYACLQRDPDERPTASELLDYPLLIPDSELEQRESGSPRRTLSQLPEASPFGFGM